MKTKKIKIFFFGFIFLKFNFCFSQNNTNINVYLNKIKLLTDPTEDFEKLELERDNNDVNEIFTVASNNEESPRLLDSKNFFDMKWLKKKKNQFLSKRNKKKERQPAFCFNRYHKPIRCKDDFKNRDTMNIFNRNRNKFNYVNDYKSYDAEKTNNDFPYQYIFDDKMRNIKTSAKKFDALKFPNFRDSNYFNKKKMYEQDYYLTDDYENELYSDENAYYDEEIENHEDIDSDEEDDLRFYELKYDPKTYKSQEFKQDSVYLTKRDLNSQLVIENQDGDSSKKLNASLFESQSKARLKKNAKNFHFEAGPFIDLNKFKKNRKKCKKKPCYENDHNDFDDQKLHHTDNENYIREDDYNEVGDYNKKNDFDYFDYSDIDADADADADAQKLGYQNSTENYNLRLSKQILNGTYSNNGGYNFSLPESEQILVSNDSSQFFKANAKSDTGLHIETGTFFDFGKFVKKKGYIKKKKKRLSLLEDDGSLDKRDFHHSKDFSIENTNSSIDNLTYPITDLFRTELKVLGLQKLKRKTQAVRLDSGLFFDFDKNKMFMEKTLDPKTNELQKRDKFMKEGPKIRIGTGLFFDVNKKKMKKKDPYPNYDKYDEFKAIKELNKNEEFSDYENSQYDSDWNKSDEELLSQKMNYLNSSRKKKILDSDNITQNNNYFKHKNNRYSKPYDYENEENEDFNLNNILLDDHKFKQYHNGKKKFLSNQVLNYKVDNQLDNKQLKNNTIDKTNLTNNVFTIDHFEKNNQSLENADSTKYNTNEKNESDIIKKINNEVDNIGKNPEREVVDIADMVKSNSTITEIISEYPDSDTSGAFNLKTKFNTYELIHLLYLTIFSIIILNF